MKLSTAQETDIKLCQYFYPSSPTDEEIQEYIDLSERGIGKERGKFSNNPLVIGKAKRGLHMRMWEEGVLEGTVPYFTLLGGEDDVLIPRYVIDFMKKEMFKGMDADIIENVAATLA